MSHFYNTSIPPRSPNINKPFHSPSILVLDGAAAFFLFEDGELEAGFEVPDEPDELGELDEPDEDEAFSVNDWFRCAESEANSEDAVAALVV